MYVNYAYHCSGHKDKQVSLEISTGKLKIFKNHWTTEYINLWMCILHQCKIYGKKCRHHQISLYCNQYYITDFIWKQQFCYLQLACMQGLFLSMLDTIVENFKSMNDVTFNIMSWAICIFVMHYASVLYCSFNDINNIYYS